jgi:hypothetical protein
MNIRFSIHQIKIVYLPSKQCPTRDAIGCVSVAKRFRFCLGPFELSDIGKLTDDDAGIDRS